MGAVRGRPQDPAVSERVLAAAAALLTQRGFAGMSMDAVAEAAGVGKPAIYRRFADKVELVVAVIQRALPPMAPPTAADPEDRLRQLIAGLPPNPEAYAALIGELMAERGRHPELMAAFREHILLPRRAIVADEFAALQAAGVLRTDLTPEFMLDMIAGPFLARAYAGVDIGPAWWDMFIDGWWRVCTLRNS